MFIGQKLGKIVLKSKISEHKNCRGQIGLKFSYRKFSQIPKGFGFILLWGFGFQTDRVILLSVFDFTIFKLKLLCIFQLDMNFCEHESCREIQGLQLLLLEFYSILNRLGITGFWILEKLLKLRFSYVIWISTEIWFCFSPDFSKELKNLPKVKLWDFKFSKTFIKGSRAESL